ncbi:unnamed protein product [Lactuca virosa]|uniref:Uncharacterized protein n=1 Tax=Lactuca virosa TaxID=75947 RepID=A0AAU9LYT7_9ASTR|nr:unnamed protein product [Lactuca virosa]
MGVISPRCFTTYHRTPSPSNRHSVVPLPLHLQSSHQYRTTVSPPPTHTYATALPLCLYLVCDHRHNTLDLRTNEGTSMASFCLVIQVKGCGLMVSKEKPDVLKWVMLHLTISTFSSTSAILKVHIGEGVSPLAAIEVFSGMPVNRLFEPMST